MFIINPLHAHKRDNLFATHPATENRVAALREMMGEISAPRAPTMRSSRIPKVSRNQRKGPWT